jgi:hypothetical protein
VRWALSTATYGLQVSRASDRRNRLNPSLCVFRRALGGGTARCAAGGSTRWIGWAVLPRPATSPIPLFANSFFALMDRGDDEASARAVVAPDAGARCWWRLRLVVALPGKVKVSGGRAQREQQSRCTGRPLAERSAEFSQSPLARSREVRSQARPSIPASAGRCTRNGGSSRA